MNADKRVTIREIAAQTGFSKSCVALALKGSPAVAKETRRKIQLAAKNLGYVPDARVSQLMAYLGKGRTTATACNLGWFNTWPDPDYWTTPLYTRNYYLGARARAASLGYGLESIWGGDPSLNPRSIMRILTARGIEGVIVPMPLGVPSMEGIDWSTISGAIISAHATEFPLNRTGCHTGHNTLVLMEKLRDLGYRRPGLWIGDYSDIDSEHAIPAMFTWAQRHWFPDDPIPLPLRMDDTPELEIWYPLCRPDVIVCASNTVVNRLRAIKVRVPQDVAVVHLFLDDDTPDWAGVQNNSADIGAAAAEMVVAQLHRDERGFVTHPTDLMVRGTWQDGWTAPRQKTAAVRRRTTANVSKGGGRRE